MPTPHDHQDVRPKTGTETETRLSPQVVSVHIDTIGSWPGASSRSGEDGLGLQHHKAVDSATTLAWSNVDGTEVSSLWWHTTTSHIADYDDERCYSASTNTIENSPQPPGPLTPHAVSVLEFTVDVQLLKTAAPGYLWRTLNETSATGTKVILSSLVDPEGTSVLLVQLFIHISMI